MNGAQVDTVVTPRPRDSRQEGGLSSALRRGRQSWPPVAAVLLLATIYGLTSPGNRSEADDAFWFAHDVEHKSLRGLLGSGHSSHLLFLPIARALFVISQAAGFNVRSYDLIRFTNCLLAALSVVLLRTVLQRRFDLSPFAAITGAAGLAVSYGFWRYASEMEVYAPAVLLILVLCHLGFSQLASHWLTSLAGLVAALAVLVHILGIIPAIVIVPLTLLLRRRIKAVLIYGAVLSVTLGGVYLAAYEYTATPRQDLAAYTFSPDPGARYSWSGAALSIVTVGQDVASVNFLFGYAKVADMLDRTFPRQFLDEERYAGARASTLVKVVPPIAVCLLALLAAALIRVMRRHSPPVHRRQAEDFHRLLVVAIWVGVYWLFLVGRSSGAPEAWIPILPALWILIAALVFESASRSRVQRLLAVAFLATLVVHNSLGGYWPLHSRSSDFNAVRASWLVHHARAEDVILVADGPIFSLYLSYYARAQVIDLEELSAAEIAKRYLAATRPPGRVFVTEGVLNPPRALRLSGKAREIDRFAKKVRPDVVRVGGAGTWNVYARLPDAATLIPDTAR